MTDLDGVFISDLHNSLASDPLQRTPQKQPPPKRAKSAIPVSIWDPFSRHKIESLYFCEFCQEIKCFRCVDEEVVCHYCPVCLFEVTPNTARVEGNRCPRNCFKCPNCSTSVNPSPITGAAAAAAAASLNRPSSSATSIPESETVGASEPSTQSAYTLACTFCSWTSSSSQLNISDGHSQGLIFQRGKTVRQQLYLVEGRQQSDVSKRFQDLQRFYFQRSLEEGTRATLLDDGLFSGGRYRNLAQQSQNRTKSSARPDDLTSELPTSSRKSWSFAEVLEKRIQERNQMDNSAESYNDIEEIDESTDQYEASLRSTAVSSKFTQYYQQQSNQESAIDDETSSANHSTLSTQIKPFDISKKAEPTVLRDQLDIQQNLPVPQPLRAKRIKRCTTCHHILAKPDVKPSSVRHKIKLMAHNYLPSLRITEYPPKSGFPKVLVPDQTYTFLLTISNSMHVDMKVSLATVSRNTTSDSDSDIFENTDQSINFHLGAMTIDKDSTNQPRQPSLQEVPRFNTNKSHPYPHKVTLVTPTVNLGAENEHYDEASLIRKVPNFLIKRESEISKRVEIEKTKRTASSAGGGGALTGVYQQGDNWSTVGIEIIPSAQGTFLEIPLFVSFSFEVPEDAEEEESAEKDDSLGPESKRERQVMTFGYWSVLGIAPIKQ